MTKTLAMLAVVGLTWPILAWLSMLAVGVIHDRWIPALPTVGYGTMLLITALIGARAGVATLAAAFAKDALEDGK